MFVGKSIRVYQVSKYMTQVLDNLTWRENVQRLNPEMMQPQWGTIQCLLECFKFQLESAKSQ